MKNFFKKLFGYCENCERIFVYPKRRHMNTKYEVEEDNYMISCKRCFDYSEECWQHQWDDYNSGKY